jgi:hypothetical protein
LFSFFPLSLFICVRPHLFFFLTHPPPPVVLIFSSMISPLFFTRTRSESQFNYLILLISDSYHHSVLALFDSLIFVDSQSVIELIDFIEIRREGKTCYQTITKNQLKNK